MKNINYFIERAENDLNNGFNFDEDNFEMVSANLETNNKYTKLFKGLEIETIQSLTKNLCPKQGKDL